MLKVHYRNSSTMALWISIDEFHSFFEEVVFCHTHSLFLGKKKLFSGYSTGNRLYLNINLKKLEKKNRIFLTLKDKSSLNSIMPQKVCGWSITNCVNKTV